MVKPGRVVGGEFVREGKDRSPNCLRRSIAGVGSINSRSGQPAAVSNSSKGKVRLAQVNAVAAREAARTGRTQVRPR